MKRNFFFTPAFFLCLFFIANSSVRAGGNNDVRISTEASVANLDAAYGHYADLGKALTNDDAAMAQKAAGQLVIALKNIPGAASAAMAASTISQSLDISVQRKSFASLTLEMEKMVKAHKLANKMLYIHYCPMAKSYWLDEVKDIRNPNYGKQMPTCGKATGMIM